MLTTGNKIVDAVGKLNISGNVIPQSWFRNITKEETGKPYLLAMMILAEIVYWYRPAEVRNEETGQLIGYRKKFKAELYQRTYASLADEFGENEKSIQRALKRLEDIGVIQRVLQTVDMGSSKLGNVLFLELIPDVLEMITYEKTEDARDTDPMDNFVHRGGQNRPDPMDNSVHSSGQKCPDITENPTETIIITEIPSHQNQSCKDESSEKNDEIEACRQLVRQKISFDDLCISHPYETDNIQEMVEILVEILANRRDAISISGVEYPYAFVCDRLWKIGYEHIEYVLECLGKNRTKVWNIKAYLLTTLFNAPLTIDNYYSAEVRHDYSAEVRHAKIMSPEKREYDFGELERVLETRNKSG